MTPRSVDSGNNVYRSEDSIPFKDAIEKSLGDREFAASDDTIYQLEYKTDSQADVS